MDIDRSLNPLPGVPLIDNPFFERLIEQPGIEAETKRIARSMREHGYATFDFPDPDIDRLCDELRARHTPSEEKFKEWRAGGAELREQDAWRTDPNVQRVASNPRVLEMLRVLYGRPAFPFQTLNFPVGTQQGVHSDASHFSSNPEGFMCGVWLALEDIDADNGPLIYYPGSHRWPQYGNEHIGVNVHHQPTLHSHIGEYRRLWDELIALQGTKPERFKGRKGQAILWHARLMHGGDKQNDMMRTRYSQVTHYYFRDCAYYTPFFTNSFYGRIHFRDVTDISSGERVPNAVAGHNVPSWFTTQATQFSPASAIRVELSRLKHKLLGRMK